MDTRVSLLPFALFFALIVGISASDDNATTSYYKRGDFAQISVATLILPPVSKCYLISPQNEEIDFLTNAFSSKYELRPSSIVSDCIVRINDLDEADEGSWSLHAVTRSGERVEHVNIAILNGTLEEQSTWATAESPTATQGHTTSYGRHHYPRGPSSHSYPLSSSHYSSYPSSGGLFTPVLNAAEPTMMMLLQEPAFLACSSGEPLLYCYFETPNGTFIHVGAANGSDLYKGECSLRLRSLTPSDTGVWKCHAGFRDASEQVGWIQVLEQEPERCYYRCASGKCITKGERCDGFAECAGREDELNCDNRSRPWSRNDTVYYPTTPTGFFIPNWRPNMTTNSPPTNKDGCQNCAVSQSDKVVVEMPGSLAADQDLHFALSLVPLLRRRTMSDKLEAQIDILSYFRSKVTRDRDQK